MKTSCALVLVAALAAHASPRHHQPEHPFGDKPNHKDSVDQNFNDKGYRCKEWRVSASLDAAENLDTATLRCKKWEKNHRDERDYTLYKSSLMNGACKEWEYTERMADSKVEVKPTCKELKKWDWANGLEGAQLYPVENDDDKDDQADKNNMFLKEFKEEKVEIDEVDEVDEIEKRGRHHPVCEPTTTSVTTTVTITQHPRVSMTMEDGRAFCTIETAAEASSTVASEAVEATITAALVSSTSTASHLPGLYMTSDGHLFGPWDHHPFHTTLG